MDSLTFEEVKLVWNKVIPDIREHILVHDLVHHLESYFATSSIEKVQAQNNQYGKTHAASAFFEEAKHKPRSFPVILAALKKIGQPEILIKILKVVIKEIRPERHEEFFKKLREAAARPEFLVDVEDEIEAASPQVFDGQPNRARAEIPVQNDPNPPVERHTVNPDNIVQGIEPIRQPAAVQLSPEVIYQRDQSSISNQGIPIGKLMSSARNKISQKLLMLNPLNNQHVWQILLDEEEDLDISAEESNEIEKSSHPGKEFYNKLMSLGYTIGDLFDMLQRHNCVDAAETVKQQSTKVSRSAQPTPPFKKDLAEFDDNNLNLAIQRTTEKQKPAEYNIPSQQPAISRGCSSGSLGENPPVSYDENIDIPGEIGDTVQNVSIDGNGTQGVKAVGDVENEKSTLHPEGERAKLAKDRASQHEGKESNLESFNDLRKPEHSKNVQTENEDDSHDFGSLDQPELFNRESNGRNSLDSNASSSGQEQGSSTASVNDGAQCQKDETKVKLPLEHVQGTAGYTGPPDSINKLHADNDLSMSSLTFDD